MSSTVHASFQQMAELIKTYMADHKVKFLMKHVPTKVYIYIHFYGICKYFI